MAKESLRVFMADDNPEILAVVQEMLEGEYVISGAANNAAAVLRDIPLLQPDFLILDISIPDMNGFEITRRLKAKQCTTRVIFLTVHEELDFIRAAFDAGASGYVFKSRLASDLFPAIDAVKAGKVFIPEAPIPQ